MNRLFIILGILATAGTVAWALFHESAPPVPASSAPKPAAAAGELPDCCQPAPSKSTMLQRK